MRAGLGEILEQEAQGQAEISTLGTGNYHVD
jgi:hypothetical protein